MTRASGRAPKSGSYPSFANSSAASSEMSSLILRVSRIFRSWFSWISRTWRICPSPSRWKTMMSSSRFKNSGRKCSRNIVCTRFLNCGLSRSRAAAISRDPRFDVRMMTVLQKSTVRPWPSVSRPSSSTWRSTLKTSEWAFSISSNRTTNRAGDEPPR